MMKLIDAKGKLFGKINVIDFLVILFLLGLTPIFYYGYKIATFTSQDSLMLQKATYKEFEVTFSSIPDKFLPLIKVGDKQYKENKIIAEITKIITNKQSKINLTAGQFEEMAYTFNLEDFSNLKVLLKLSVVPVMGHFIYQGNPLKINSEISFSTDKYLVKGFIPLPNTMTNPTREILVTLQVNNLMPEIASIIKKGDKETLFEKKIKIAEIIGIVKIENAKILRFHEGVTRQFENPFYRDITVDIKIFADQIQNKYFFKNKPVEIGTRMLFSTDKYSFTGTMLNLLIK